MTDEKQVYLTKEQAILCLAEREEVHTFTNPGTNILFGCDLGRQTIIDMINRCEKEEDIQLGGELCRGMNHGLVIWDYDTERWLFIEAIEEKLKEFDV